MVSRAVQVGERRLDYAASPGLEDNPQGIDSCCQRSLPNAGNDVDRVCDERGAIDCGTNSRRRIDWCGRAVSRVGVEELKGYNGRASSGGAEKRTARQITAGPIEQPGHPVIGGI